jgi:hypothetical protein
MIRKQAVLTALVASLVTGLGSVAYAQTTQPTQPSGEDPTHSSGRSTGSRGSTNPQGTTDATNKKHQQFEHERTMLKDKVSKAVSQADDGIRTLQQRESNDTGATKKRDETEVKKLSDLKDKLNDDLAKIDRATVGDWSKVRSEVQRNLSTFSAEQKRIAQMTKKPTPRTGVTAPQAPSNPNPSNK